jgi:hypothetical protein
MREFFETIRDYPTETAVLALFIYWIICTIFRKDD